MACVGISGREEVFVLVCTMCATEGEGWWMVVKRGCEQEVGGEEEEHVS